MKYNIASNNNKVLDHWISWLSSLNFTYSPDNYEYLFVIGGDGTYLTHWRNLEENNTSKPIKLIGITNKDSTGFLLNTPSFKTTPFFSDKDFIPYNILSISTPDNNFFSCNEVIFQHKTTITIEVSINNSPLMTFTGTSILLSTPQGSTGLNKSSKGPIIPITLPLWSLLEIQTLTTPEINTLNNPLILSNKDTITLTIKTPFTLITDTVCYNLLPTTINVSLIPSKTLHYYPNSNQTYIKKLRSTYCEIK